MKTKINHKSMIMLSNYLICCIFILTSVIISYIFTPQNLAGSLFYTTVILLAVGLAALSDSSKKRFVSKLWLTLSFLVLFFILGFRNFSAVDDPSYISIFNNISNLGPIEYFKESTIEPGYIILNYLVLFFTKDYLYMQLLSSFIPLFLFYYGFYKYKKHISLPIAVFLLCSMIYFQMLSVALIRMFIAMAIFFLSLESIQESNPKKYVFQIILASMFHYSSFIMIFLVYFAIDEKRLSVKMKNLYLLIFISSPIVLIAISRILVPLLGARYSSYGSIQNISIGLDTFTTLPPILLLLLFYKKFEGKERLYFKLYIFIFSLSIIISIFGGMVNVGRLIFYSYVSFILGGSMVAKANKNNSTKIIFMSIIIVYGLVYLYYTQFLNPTRMSNLFPYFNLFFTI